MKVNVKGFNVEMELKNNGIEFEVRDTNDSFLGDLILTKTNLIWCEGKTGRNNGKKLSLKDFRSYMNSRN